MWSGGTLCGEEVMGAWKQLPFPPVTLLSPLDCPALLSPCGIAVGWGHFRRSQSLRLIPGIFCIPRPSPESSRRWATSSVNSKLFKLTRLYMMMAQKFMAPKMARTLRDICSDREACWVQENIGSEARGPGERGRGGSEALPMWPPGSWGYACVPESPRSALPHC